MVENHRDADEPALEPPAAAAGRLEPIIVPRTSDLGGGFEVRRALPSRQRRMVGPFIFFDQMGPIVFRAGTGLDVRPHPHIGLATVTYLFEGGILHRDSLGTVQPIQPGAVNWMTAGSGIVHSERTGPDVRAQGGPLFGIQSWVALPQAHEETAPAFAHHDRDSLPVIEGDGAHVRLIAGTLCGARSPVRTVSAMVYADVRLEPGARLVLRAEHEERAAYPVDGSVELAGCGEAFGAGQLLIFRPGTEIVLSAAKSAPARLMLLGGEPMDGPRHIWWNFVSSSKERIEQAKADWKEGRFASVPAETEFIPLPGQPQPPPVRYP
jgi:redox-sensitive bicupin YhaK (pirin superfamily)